MPGHVPRVLLAGLLLACDERERLTFPSNLPGNDDQGPITVIDAPARDTTLTEGEPFIVSGRSIDPNGIATVFFLVENGDVNFSPVDGAGSDTVRFGLPIPTVGRFGQTITITVHAEDTLSNLGGPAIRRLTVQ